MEGEGRTLSPGPASIWLHFQEEQCAHFTDCRKTDSPLLSLRQCQTVSKTPISSQPHRERRVRISQPKRLGPQGRGAVEAKGLRYPKQNNHGQGVGSIWSAQQPGGQVHSAHHLTHLETEAQRQRRIPGKRGSNLKFQGQAPGLGPQGTRLAGS